MDNIFNRCTTLSHPMDPRLYPPKYGGSSSQSSRPSTRLAPKQYQPHSNERSQNLLDKLKQNLPIGNEVHVFCNQIIKEGDKALRVMFSSSTPMPFEGFVILTSDNKDFFKLQELFTPSVKPPPVSIFIKIRNISNHKVKKDMGFVIGIKNETFINSPKPSFYNPQVFKKAEQEKRSPINCYSSDKTNKYDSTQKSYSPIGHTPDHPLTKQPPYDSFDRKYDPAYPSSYFNNHPLHDSQTDSNGSRKTTSNDTIPPPMTPPIEIQYSPTHHASPLPLVSQAKIPPPMTPQPTSSSLSDKAQPQDFFHYCCKKRRRADEEYAKQLTGPNKSEKEPKIDPPTTIKHPTSDKELESVPLEFLEKTDINPYDDNPQIIILAPSYFFRPDAKDIIKAYPQVLSLMTEAPKTFQPMFHDSVANSNWFHWVGTLLKTDTEDFHLKIKDLIEASKSNDALRSEMLFALTSLDDTKRTPLQSSLYEYISQDQLDHPLLHISVTLFNFLLEHCPSFNAVPFEFLSTPFIFSNGEESTLLQTMTKNQIRTILHSIKPGLVSYWMPKIMSSTNKSDTNQFITFFIESLLESSSQFDSDDEPLKIDANNSSIVGNFILDIFNSHQTPSTKHTFLCYFYESRVMINYEGTGNYETSIKSIFKEIRSENKGVANIPKTILRFWKALRLLLDHF